MVSIVKTKLNLVKKVELFKLQDCFRQSFPKDSWYASFPDPKVDIYIAKDEKVIVGFCCVSNPPQPFKQDDAKLPQTYMYNLCVHPAHRSKGVGSALVEAVRRESPTNMCFHVVTDSDHHKWFMKRGFHVIGKFREIYVEYVSWRPKVVAPPSTFAADTTHYDPIEGIVYLD